MASTIWVNSTTAKVLSYIDNYSADIMQDSFNKQRVVSLIDY